MQQPTVKTQWESNHFGEQIDQQHVNTVFLNTMEWEKFGVVTNTDDWVIV